MLYNRLFPRQRANHVELLIYHLYWLVTCTLKCKLCWLYQRCRQWNRYCFKIRGPGVTKVPCIELSQQYHLDPLNHIHMWHVSPQLSWGEPVKHERDIKQMNQNFEKTETIEKPGNQFNGQPLGPISRAIFHRNSNSMETSFCSHSSCSKFIAIKFLRAVLSSKHFPWSWISMNKSFVKRAPACHQ